MYYKKWVETFYVDVFRYKFHKKCVYVTIYCMPLRWFFVYIPDGIAINHVRQYIMWNLYYMYSQLNFFPLFLLRFIAKLHAICIILSCKAKFTYNVYFRIKDTIIDAPGGDSNPWHPAIEQACCWLHYPTGNRYPRPQITIVKLDAKFLRYSKSKYRLIIIMFRQRLYNIN